MNLPDKKAIDERCSAWMGKLEEHFPEMSEITRCMTAFMLGIDSISVEEDASFKYTLLVKHALMCMKRTGCPEERAREIFEEGWESGPVGGEEMPILPMVMLTEDDMGEPIGETIKCPHCGELHGIKTHGDTAKLHTYTCGENSYVCGLNGRAIKEKEAH